MAELTITTFATLDGVMQAPGGPEEDAENGFRYGGWGVPHFDEEVGGFIDGIFRQAEAFLLGRRTYEIFAAHWPKVPNQDDLVAHALNTFPKYVATRTLSSLEWAASSVVRDPIADLSRLKERHRGELQVHGSAGLVRSLLAHGFVDELRLITFPVVVGRGKRLFDEDTAPTGLRLVEAKVSGTGVIMSRYRPTGPVQVGSFALET